jgi:spermidine synthase
MVLELVGSRVVSPYYGNTLFVWTSLIGIILSSLSIGYYWGGKISDKNSSYRFLSSILFAAGICVAVSALTKETILMAVSAWLRNYHELSIILSVCILFAPVSVIFGIVSPYLVRLKLDRLNNSGAVVGNLYAVSTLGSITGTFVTGFYLIPVMGNTNILYLVSGLLILLSFFALNEENTGKFLSGLFVVLCAYLFWVNISWFRIAAVADVDSRYSRILVRDAVLTDGRTIRYLSTDNQGQQSEMDINNKHDLVAGYLKIFRLATEVKQPVKRALLIGGGAYIYPRDFLSRNPGAVIDVVEIDPEMTEISRKYFFLNDDPRMSIINEDARTFVKNMPPGYDLIFLDAFSGLTPPVHLTTREFMSDLNRALTGDGILVLNMVSGLTGDKSGFFTAEVNTLLTGFPVVEVYSQKDADPSRNQNLVLFAYKKYSGADLPDLNLNKKIIRNVSVSGIVLTDDYAPVEYLTRYLDN